MKNKLLLLLSAISIVFGCVKVSELDGSGDVVTFEVVPGTITEGVSLSESPIEINKDAEEKYIYVNIEKGIHVTPIEFEAKIKINDSADKIISSQGDEFKIKTNDNGETVYSFSFIQSDATVAFYVIGENGQANKWNVKLKFSILSDKADIVSFTIPELPSGVVVSQTPNIKNEYKQIDLYHSTGRFPLTLEPNIVISENATLDGDYSKITFSLPTDIKTIKVISESGYVSAWALSITTTSELTSSDNLSRGQIARMRLNYSNIAPKVSGVEMVLPISIDDINSTIDVFLSSTDFNSSSKVNLNITSISGSEVLGKTDVSFSPDGTTRNFIYMIDQSSNIYRKWVIAAKEQTSAMIIVKDVTFANQTGTNGEVVNPRSYIDVKNKQVWFNINKSLSHTITLNEINCLTNNGTTTTMPQQISFNAINDPLDFEITAADGTTKETWTIMLKYQKASSETELFDFSFSTENLDWTAIHIEQVKKQITIEVNQRGEVGFTPLFSLSKGAELLSEDNTIGNDVYSVAMTNKPIVLSILAEDGASIAYWTIEFVYAPQLENRGFESLNSWGSANVTSPIKLEGTKTVRRDTENGNAVEVTTLKQNALVFGNLVAAATVYKGSFKMSFSLIGIDNPRIMTRFGIPYRITTLPISFSIDAKYLVGTQLKQAVKSGSKYEIKDAEGIDKGQVWMEMLNYTMNDGDMAKVPNSYSGEGKNGLGEPAEGVSVVSRANLIIEGDDSSFKNWKNNNIVNFEDKDTKREVTHVAFVATSSFGGDKYLGAIGSVLTTDNIVLLYYQPEAGAVTKRRK